MGENLRISATAFTTFRQCPQRANARIQGYYGEPSLVSFVGSLAHQIFKRHLTDGPIDSAELSLACRQEMGKSQNLGNTSVQLGLTMADLERTFAEVGGLYARFAAVPHEGFDRAEQMLEVDAGTGLTLVGQIDAVFVGEEGTRLVDWKTGGLGEADSQLLFYGLLWAMVNGDLPVAVSAVSVKTGESSSTVPTGESLQELALELGAMVDELRTAWATGGELERRGGPWCEYCPILQDCREGKSALEVLD